jgi:hypothetical protein
MRTLLGLPSRGMQAAREVQHVCYSGLRGRQFWCRAGVMAKPCRFQMSACKAEGCRPAVGVAMYWACCWGNGRKLVLYQGWLILSSFDKASHPQFRSGQEGDNTEAIPAVPLLDI